MKRVDRFASAIILFAILGVGAIIAYLLYKHLHGTPTPLYYYGAVGGVLVLLLASLRLSSNHRLNVVILMISVLSMLYSMEAMLFIFGNPLAYRTPRYMAAQHSGIEYDTRTPLQVVDQLRKEGIDAYPYVAPNYFIEAMPATNDEPIYALGGIANVTTVMCNESGDYITYESDRYGFANPDLVWDEPELEIVALGDSFTQGACVPSETNMVSRIRERYPRTLNLGSSGSGPLGMLASLKEYGAIYQPPVVLWFYFEGNDLGDMLEERKNPFLMEYLTGDFTQNLMGRQSEVDEVRRKYVVALIDNLKKARRNEMVSSLRLYNVRRLLNLTREPMPKMNQVSDYIPLFHLLLYKQAIAQTLDPETEIDPIFNEGIDLFEEVLHHARDYVAGWGGELIVVYLPDYMRYDVEEPVTEEAMYRLEILPVIKALDVPMIDLHKAFSTHSEPAALFPFQMQGHYNEDGYAVVAQEVLTFLEQRNMDRNMNQGEKR